MNAKYFEENGFEDFHGTKFHKAVLDHAACIANNLMFDATHPDNNDGETAANAYHVMIRFARPGFPGSTRSSSPRAASSSPTRSSPSAMKSASSLPPFSASNRR